MLGDDDVSTKARAVFDFLAATHGEGCHQDLANELNVTPPRVTQLKGELAGVLDRYGYPRQLKQAPPLRLTFSGNRWSPRPGVARGCRPIPRFGRGSSRTPLNRRTVLWHGEMPTIRARDAR
jgi:hypothetical protein